MCTVDNLTTHHAADRITLIDLDLSIGTNKIKTNNNNNTKLTTIAYICMLLHKNS